MSYLSGFGFKVFRLRETKETEEYVLYEKETGKFNQYSFTRLISYIKDEFESRNFYFPQIADELLKYDKQQKISPHKIIKNWVECESILLDNLGYEPEDNMIIKDEDKKLFNIYKKSWFLKKFKSSNEYDFPTIKKILLNLVDNDEEGLSWFLQRLAFIIQKPKKRLPTAIIFQGNQGTGKGLMCNYILKPLFSTNFNEISQSQINSEFNDWAMGKQIIVANEVIHQENKYLVPDRLKNLVTDEYVPIRRMHKSSVLMKNYATYIFTSNHMIPLRLEKDDRRFTVFKSKTLKNGFKLYKSIQKNSDKELTNFISYLLDLDIDEEFVSKPYENEARKDLIRFNQNSVEEFISYAEDIGGFVVLNEHYNSIDEETQPYFDKMHIEEIRRAEGIFIQTQSLYNLYLRFCQDFGYTKKYARTNFTKTLKFLNYEPKVIKINNQTIRSIRIQEVQR